MSSALIRVEREMASTLAGGATFQVDRSYPGEYAREQLPSINLVPTGWEENENESDGDSVALVAEWAIIARAAGTVATPTSEEIDALVVWVWFRLMADQTLGGIVRELRVFKGAYQYDAKDVDIAQCQIDVRATFDVRRGDLTASYDTEG